MVPTCARAAGLRLERWILLLILSLLNPLLLSSSVSGGLGDGAGNEADIVQEEQRQQEERVARVLHSAHAFRYGLPLDHTFDPSLFYRPSFASSSPSYFAATTPSRMSSLTPPLPAFASASRTAPAPRQSIPQAVALYHEAAALNSSLALLSLAEIALFGEGASTVDVAAAVPLLHAAAALGSARAQHLLAVLYHSGVGVARDSARSLLYGYFAALSGDPLSLMAMGWRHSVGDGVPRSCDAALGNYHRVARRVVRELEADSVSHIIEKVRLQADDAGETAARSVVSDPVEEDLLLSYTTRAERGDTSAQLALANVLLYGTHGLIADYPSAAHYFQAAAAAGDAHAQTQLAFMRAHGIGVDKDESAAFALLSALVSSGRVVPAAAFNLMGRAYELGWGVDADDVAALAFFQQAAVLAHADGQYNAGRLLYEGRGGEGRQHERALELWVQCARLSHTLCMYHLASLYRSGQGGGVQSCDLALPLYKAVSERGRWGFGFMSAFRRWSIGDVEAALLTYLRLAFEGHETAQSNAAYMLHHGYGYAAVRRAAVDPAPAALYQHRLALAHALYTQSSLQKHAASHRMLGDFAYMGLPPHTASDYDAALVHYRHAAEGGDAHASYDVGWLMEWVRGDWAAASVAYERSAGKKNEAVAVVWAAKVRMALHRALRVVWSGDWLLVPTTGVTKGSPWVDWTDALAVVVALAAWMLGRWRQRGRRGE